MTVHDLDDDVNVVRHTAPGEEPIAIAVEMEECALDQCGNIGPGEPAGTSTGIEPFVDEANGIVSRHQCVDDCFWQAVGQPECHELDGLGCVEMREVSAGVPAFGLHVQA